MARVVVIGGHGKVALQLARVLTERGDQVTSVFRNPDHSDDVAATGAEPVVADIEKLDTNALARIMVYRQTIRSSPTRRPRRRRTPTCARATWTGRCSDPAGSPSSPRPDESRSTGKCAKSRVRTSHSS